MDLFIDLDAAGEAVAALRDAAGPIDTAAGPEFDVHAHRTPNVPPSVASAFSAAHASGRVAAHHSRVIAECIEVGAQITRLADRIES